MRDRRERRNREGRLVLPAHGEEAPAGTGGRAAEPAALHLPRRLGRCFPAAAGRGLPRPRPLRPDLLQPGAAVGARHPADRRRHGLVHRGGRVRPRDVGRDGDRSGDGHDLHRRPAAREGRDGSGRDRGGARRRRRPHEALRCGRPLRDLRRARPRDRPRDRATPRSPTPDAVGARAGRSNPSSTRPSYTASCPRTSATSSTHAR